MPKKQKCAAVSRLASDLVCPRPRQGLEESSTSVPALADPGVSPQGKLVEVQFGGEVPASSPSVEQLQELALRVPCQKAIGPQSSFPHSALPDRSFGFAQAVHERIGGALLRCEERYPVDSHQPVLYVVVRDSAVRWEQQLQSLHREYFHAGEAFPLEVIEQAADDLLQRMVSTGLVAETVRLTRPLWPPGAEVFFSPLPDGRRKRAAARRQGAARKFKMAPVLAAGAMSQQAKMA